MPRLPYERQNGITKKSYTQQVGLTVIPKPQKECVHLQELIGLVDCKSCKGTVRIKQFGCAVLGECTLNQCRSCKHYVQKNTDEK